MTYVYEHVEHDGAEIEELRQELAAMTPAWIVMRGSEGMLHAERGGTKPYREASMSVSGLREAVLQTVSRVSGLPHTILVTSELVGTTLAPVGVTRGLNALIPGESVKLDPDAVGRADPWRSGSDPNAPVKSADSGQARDSSGKFVSTKASADDSANTEVSDVAAAMTQEASRAGQ